MSKSTKEQEITVEEQFETDLGPEDFGFIITSAGELKACYLPEDATVEVPDVVFKILKMYGVDDPDAIEPPTIH